MGLAEAASIKDYFESAGGLEALQSLSENSNFEIYSASNEIVQKFFTYEEEMIFSQ
jgi:hypothetical protein